jgi:hypothetical protein
MLLDYWLIFKGRNDREHQGHEDLASQQRHALY